MTHTRLDFKDFFIGDFLFTQFPYEMGNEDHCLALMRKHQISPNASSSNLQRSQLTPFLVIKLQVLHQLHVAIFLLISLMFFSLVSLLWGIF